MTLSSSIVDDRVARILASVSSRDDGSLAVQSGDIEWLVHARDEEVQFLLQALVASLTERRIPHEQRLAVILRNLVERAHLGGDRSWKRLTAGSRLSVVNLYQRLGRTSRVRHALLQLLAVSRGADDLRAFAEWMVNDPPADATSVAVASGPLFQHRDYDPLALFPRLLDALGQPVIAPIVMDLANYVKREQMLDQHPATPRREQLTKLLGGLVERLGVVEERPEEVSSNAKELSTIVSQAVSLAVSLCDAMGLIGDPMAIGKLNQVLELRHRRLRTEAAAALARLGDENGKQVLVSLAAEPVARLRVLAYAEELGIDGGIDERFATPVARAEAELACWLAQPTQLGFPPSKLEWVDSQCRYWPGYDEPVDCFLFRFAYEVGNGEYSGIGIAGPLCHAFAADLADLPPDDIYAVFAGWHAEHEEIGEFDVHDWTAPQRIDAARLERRLRDDGYDSIQPVTLGVFFGEKALVARAVLEGQSGIAVATRDAVQWLPNQGVHRPLGPHEAFCLFMGRRLLRALNP